MNKFKDSTTYAYVKSSGLMNVLNHQAASGMVKIKAEMLRKAAIGLML